MAANAWSVTPSDAGNVGVPIGLLLALTFAPAEAGFQEPFDRLYIGGTGAVAIQDMSGNSVTFAAVPVGILNVPGRRVLATNTAATNIVAIRDT